MVEVRIGEMSLIGVDSFGVEWVLESLEGWTGSTASTRQSQQRARQSGSWSGRGYSTARSIGATGHLIAGSALEAEEALDRLNGAVTLEDSMVTVTEGSRSRWQMFHRSDAVLDTWLNDRVIKWSLQMASDDWRKFGTQMQGTTTLPSTSGGLTVPFTVPFTINATTVTGQVSLTNSGNTPGPVVLRIDGPVQGPVVTHVSSGAQLVFSSSIVIGPGEFLLIDMDARTVLANGQASRNGWITARGWSAFEPGPNTWAFTAASFDPASRLTVMATPAWK